MLYILNNHDKFDLLITELLLPIVDGQTLIEEMNAKHFKKKIVVTSNYVDEYIVKNTKRFNIIAVYQKPLSLSSIERQIKEKYNMNTSVTTSEDDIKLRITDILHDLGIPSHLKGFQYLREAIYVKYTDPTVIYVTKDLYPRIANTFNTKDDCVERAIRHAIEVGSIRGNFDYQEKLFRHSTDTEKSRPTNYEYISTITERLKFDKDTGNLQF